MLPETTAPTGTAVQFQKIAPCLPVEKYHLGLTLGTDKVFKYVSFYPTSTLTQVAREEEQRYHGEDKVTL